VNYRLSVHERKIVEIKPRSKFAFAGLSPQKKTRPDCSGLALDSSSLRSL
jgi:hypothetical protein